MTAGLRLVAIGRVGRPHGLDGSFKVDGPREQIVEGMVVTVAGVERRVERLAGTARHPLVRLAGIGDRDSAAALGGELVQVQAADAPLAEDEWLASDLLGCRVEGLGTVQRVTPGLSCDVLELDGGVLVPLISDAVTRVDVRGRLIEVDRAFLGLET